jgi:lysyl-tRNA synthetase class 1
MEAKSKGQHWADSTAEKIVREKGPKARYTCASGITPSGTVHIGNFREIISVELVARALREMGHEVRFIYSWDDYDVFRKVPKNMPMQEVLEAHLRFPITLVPDPFGRDESYARHHEVDVERILPEVGVAPEFLYQAERYRSSMYAEGMRRALEKKALIKEILDEFRQEELGDDWWPVSIFCDACNKDTTKVLSWDGEWALRYSCECGHEAEIDLRKAKGAKLFWRIDWPMRWAREGVDFEPAGKDHHSQGGSFDTARRISREVYGHEPPVTFQYDFIGIKGRGGKISSSSGDVVDLYDVLEVYQPEIARYLFAGTRPNTEFTISFDLDVIKIYEDYDRTERIYWGLEEASEEKRAKESRIYELSQVAAVPAHMPYQAPFRHLSSILQINDGDIARTRAAFEREAGRAFDAIDLKAFERRAACCAAWLGKYAPEDFKFSLRAPGEKAPLAPSELSAVAELRDYAAAATDWGKSFTEGMYAIAAKHGLDTKAFFRAVYQALVGKDQGPRLASFLESIGKERIGQILSAY